MPKRRMKLAVRIPKYVTPRNQWRRKIFRAVRAAASGAVRYSESDRLELHLRLYFADEKQVGIHDVDNRLKDVMDALQGRMGGPKKNTPKERIIPNDHQIYRVIVEKQKAPWQSHNKGHLVIRKLSR